MPPFGSTEVARKALAGREAGGFGQSESGQE